MRFPSHKAGIDKAAQASVKYGQANTYVLNTNSKKFHNPDCSSVSKISENNKQVFEGTREELIDDGYSPCGICKPWYKKCWQKQKHRVLSYKCEAHEWNTQENKMQMWRNWHTRMIQVHVSIRLVRVQVPSSARKPLEWSRGFFVVERVLDKINWHKWDFFFQIW